MRIKFIKEEPKKLKLNLKSGKVITRKYVDDIQTVIAPTTPQITKKESKELNEFNIDNTIKDVKMKSAMKLINLAINKGVIESDDKDFELEKVLSLDDESFKSYQDEILNFDDSHSVTSNFQEDKTLTEAERALKRIRGGESSSSYNKFSNSGNGDFNETRDLSQNNNRKILDDLYSGKLPSFKEEDFDKIMLERIENNLQNNETKLKTNYKEEQYAEKLYAENEYKYNKKDLTGFENIQGLKKPIQIPSKPTSSYKDIFSELDWTIGSKNIKN